MRKVNLRSIPGLTLFTAVIAIAMTLVTPFYPQFVFDQKLAATVAPWQLVTGHLVHADVGHLAWNVLALLVIGTMLERRSRPAWLAAFVIGLMAVNSFLLSGLSSVQFYVGLSGLLNTFLFVLLWQLRREQPFVTGAVAIIAVVKMIVEVTTGQSLVTAIAWPPYAEAHVAGAVGALIYVYMSALCKRPLLFAPLDGVTNPLRLAVLLGNPRAANLAGTR